MVQSIAVLSACCAYTLYSKVSIIWPGRYRLLEFEKKDGTDRVIETFSKYPDQVI